VSTVQEVAALKVPDPDKVAYLTQTTLSLDEAQHMIEALKRKFPNIVGRTRRISATRLKIGKLR